MSFAKTPGTPVGGGTVHPGGSVADPELATLLKQYKRGVASRYKGLRRSELEEVQPGGIHVSPKIDGELWFMVPNEGAVVLASHNGRVLQGNIALLTEAAATFGARAGAGAVIAGELFAVGRKPRARVGDVARCLGSSGDSKLLGFQAFDLVRMPDGEPPPESYAERLALFQEWLEGGKRVQAVKTEVVGDHAAIEERYDTWVASGKAEGVIARAANGRIYKIKPEFTIDCAVLGFTERTEDPGQARSLLLGLFREDGSVQVVSSCGNLGTAERRSALHAALVDTVVPSQFRRVSHSGAMFRLVKPTMVVEVKCTDAAAEDGAGEPIRQWTLRLDGALHQKSLPEGLFGTCRVAHSDSLTSASEGRLCYNAAQPVVRPPLRLQGTVT